MNKKQRREHQKRFILMLVVGFFVVAFLTGCMFTGPMGTIKHNDSYVQDESLLIPPNTLKESISDSN